MRGRIEAVWDVELRSKEELLVYILRRELLDNVLDSDGVDVRIKIGEAVVALGLAADAAAKTELPLADLSIILKYLGFREV